MSAYIVNKRHILFLIQSALSRRLSRAQGSSFSWYVDDATKPGGYRRSELYPGDYEAAAEAANMLWRENIASVSCRYPNESSSTLPGPISENFVIEARDLCLADFPVIDPVQVLKACDCFEYQSCEHAEWNTSEAKAFIQTLRKAAWTSLPGYDEAKWGAPEVGHKPSLTRN